jgi:hypothetical protein
MDSFLFFIIQKTRPLGTANYQSHLLLVVREWPIASEVYVDVF